MWCTHTVAYYLAIKKKEVSIPGINLKIIMLIKPDTKGRLLYNSAYLTHPEQANPLTEIYRLPRNDEREA